MIERMKRVFSKKQQPESVTKSHRYTVEMWQAIEQLADKMGETPNAFVVLILDQYLQIELEKGNLKMPGLSVDKTA